MTKVAYEDRPYRLGVGILLFNAQGKVFVGRRIDTDAEAWQMPQGGIDEGEDPQIAAFREMEEEIGTAKAELVAESRDWIAYDLPPELAGKVWKGKYRGQKQKWYALRFTGRDSDIDIATKHPEFSHWKWAEFEDLPAMIVPFKRALYEKVVAEFRPVAQELARGAVG